MKAHGIIIRRSGTNAKATIDHVADFLKSHGATIYARIDQQAEAQKAGIELPPLEFLLFGNPKKGALVMSENILAALDLPLKIISWTDTDGQSWVAFNDVSYLSSRFGLIEDSKSPLDLSPMIEQLLKNQTPGQ